MVDSIGLKLMSSEYFMVRTPLVDAGDVVAVDIERLVILTAFHCVQKLAVLETTGPNKVEMVLAVCAAEKRHNVHLVRRVEKYVDVADDHALGQIRQRRYKARLKPNAP